MSNTVTWKISTSDDVTFINRFGAILTWQPSDIGRVPNGNWTKKGKLYDQETSSRSKPKKAKPIMESPFSKLYDLETASRSKPKKEKEKRNL